MFAQDENPEEMMIAHECSVQHSYCAIYRPRTTGLHLNRPHRTASQKSRRLAVSSDTGIATSKPTDRMQRSVAYTYKTHPHKSGSIKNQQLTISAVISTATV